ncbi:Superfamily I DNA and/or RNA helicase [Caminicella sporogenes DSM 14501]|uniref:Superfamily I DNA and/or RNA helicase n=1 Tax=Caminicella sporogenes DSM 14501 TaxID=1121266 RepID=A0A1M6PI29_9FIRM|nr:AAA domain-containing protein [Caminicella sporogenes]RKD21392.1 hypothetical protein BET04_08090 [Caminicella sporogenes]SHK07601.1 Superfamily I DNA and/or RNA helicase [Caminicella sporogenes DSM 14501]
MEYIFDKSILKELSNDNGCMKYVINRLDQRWQEECNKNNIDKNSPIRDYLINNKKLISKHTLPDKPPLQKYQEEGNISEALMIYELSYRYNIGTNLNNKNKDDIYEKFLDTRPNSCELLFDRNNRNELKSIIKNGKFKNKDLCVIINSTSQNLQFKDIMNPNKYRYIYQFKFDVNDNFYYQFIKDNNILNKIRVYDKRIKFDSFKPDLIEIIKSKDPKYLGCDILDLNYNIKKSDNTKIKLKICDIKKSEFNSGYFIELGIYMLALNSFLISNKLDKIYEVVANASIYPQKNDEDDIERETRIQDPNYELEEYVAEYVSIQDSIKNIFNKGIINVIDLIEQGNTKEYNKIKLTSKCQTCDYYGGQFSDKVKEKVAQLNEENGTNITIEQYYNDPLNNYCRYKVLNTNDINQLTCLKNGAKSVLLSRGIDDIAKLQSEAMNNNSILFDENISLKAEKETILNSIKLINQNKKYEYIPNSKTMNIPKFSNLTFFIEERHDSQQRSLSFSFIYSFTGKDSNGNVVKENNFKSPYIAILDDNSFTKRREKREFLDFLIEINNIMIKYENYLNNYNKPATYSINYWGDKCIEHFKNLFIEVFKFIKSKGNGIEDIYRDLTLSQIKDKKREITKLLYRFDSFFTYDGELEDYRVVEKSPFFDLKKGIEDILSINTKINNTLHQVHNIISSSKQKKPLYHKPDSDDFNGFVFSNIWNNWKNNVEKRKFINSIENIIKDRLFMMYNIFTNIDSKYKKGESPNIPLLPNISMFPKLKFGLDLYLFSKLNAAYSLIEKEAIHNEMVYRKSVLGKAMFLKKEIKDNIRLSTTNQTKDEILNKHFNGKPFTKCLYKVYEIDDNSVDANYDEKAFGIIIYPFNKSEYIYKKFATKQYPNTIYYDPEKELIGFDPFTYKEKGRTTKSYKDAISISIEAFDRFDKYIILKLDTDTLMIFDLLENKYGFDFSRDIVLETKHVDIWSNRLKSCLNRIQNKKIAVELLEEFDPKLINSYTKLDIEKEMKKYYSGYIPLNVPQIEAIVNIINHRLTLLWGPPGTGKTHTILHLLMFYYNIKKGQKTRILIMGNYDATDNILKGIVNKLDFSDVSVVRVKSANRPDANLAKFSLLQYEEFIADTSRSDYDNEKDRILKLKNNFQIFTATPEQIEKVFVKGATNTRFKFDLIIIDEASQMDVGHFTPALLKIDNNTQILLAGDHLQLSPISKVSIDEGDKNYYSSIFNYYNNEFYSSYRNILRRDLLYNRRSNRVIVDFGKLAFSYPSGYKSDSSIEDKKIQYMKQLNYNYFYDLILNPDYPIVLLTYDDGNSNQYNKFEAEEVIKITKNIYDKKIIGFGKGSEYDLFEFFDKGVGIVVPHRAQRTRIQKRLIEIFTPLVKAEDAEKLKEKIIASVDTVEKYQGQQREIIICSFVLGNIDIIAQEEEFIYNPNRLNVMISRARFKVIVLASNELISNVSDNYEVIELQKSLKKLLDYCEHEVEINERDWKCRKGKLRYKSF